MTTLARFLLLGLSVTALLAPAAPAGAFWRGLGAGAGSGAAATMPAGKQPSGAVSSRSVTVSWAQNAFLGTPLGAYGGGGYTVTRYADSGTTASAPNASCAATIAGVEPTLQCIEDDVPYGAWRYSVTPVLNSFTGMEGPRSATVEVATAAPVLDGATARNPTAEQTTGDVELGWASVSGATGYNVFRRTASGAYDFSSPVNGSTPVTGTTYTDAGSGLASASYAYVVRALAGSPAVASASSNELTVTTISRPAAPAGAVTATAAAGARVDVGWSSVAGVAGYNLYRRTAAGAYDFSSPVNGGTPLSAVAYADLAAVHATTYHYVVRSVITGAGDAQVESASSAESSAVTADGVAPPAPTAVSVTSGGDVWSTTSCGVASGTRYVNAAGASSVGVSATISAPEAGETVVLSATTSGSTPVTSTVAATGTTVTATLNLATLLDGTVTLTARTRDLAGNLSSTVAPTNTVLKDTVVPPLTASYSGGLLGASPTISGSSECGATIRAVKTSGGNVGKVFTTTIGSGTSYSMSVEGPLLGLGSVSYDVTSTDRAGNLSPVRSVSG
ncbi:MAG TPA: hypothetical protein VM299_05445 [Solirubrobacteraceae bacterium]|nr:hypothetical protein [Solirubrobacteraceae bacterium]